MNLPISPPFFLAFWYCNTRKCALANHICFCKTSDSVCQAIGKLFLEECFDFFGVF